VAALHQKGQHEQAIVVAKRALEVAEDGYGPNHANVGRSLNDLGSLYQTQHRYAEAEPLHKRSLAILERALGPNHPYVGTSLANIAELCRLQGSG